MMTVNDELLDDLEREEELEQLRRRVAVLEKMIAVLKKYDGAISCPYHIGLIKAVCRDYATCSACWTAALAQAEGGE